MAYADERHPGAGHPAFFIESAKFHEVTDHLIYVRDVEYTTTVVANADFWQGLGRAQEDARRSAQPDLHPRQGREKNEAAVAKMRRRTTQAPDRAPHRRRARAVPQACRAAGRQAGEHGGRPYRRKSSSRSRPTSRPPRQSTAPNKSTLPQQEGAAVGGALSFGPPPRRRLAAIRQEI